MPPCLPPRRRLHRRQLAAVVFCAPPSSTRLSVRPMCRWRRRCRPPFWRRSVDCMPAATCRPGVPACLPAVRLWQQRRRPANLYAARLQAAWTRTTKAHPTCSIYQPAKCYCASYGCAADQAGAAGGPLPVAASSAQQLRARLVTIVGYQQTPPCRYIQICRSSRSRGRTIR